VLLSIPVFYFVNKVILAWYYGRGGLLYADNESLINPLLILAEIILLAFILCQSKRRFQYGLRTLLIVVTLFAVACSWFAVKLQQAKTQREAVEAILKWNTNTAMSFGKLPASVLIRYGLQVETSYNRTEPPIQRWLRHCLGDDFLYDVLSVNIYNADLTKTDLIPLTQLKAIETLFATQCKINDDSLKLLKDFPRLQMLYLPGTNATDAGLKHLAGLNKLQHLSLSNTRITDAGLVHLAGMTQLIFLDVSNTSITDTGLKTLSRLPQLNYLDISGTKITDEGLKHLKKMPKLNKLRVWNTNVTDDGLKDLQKALPHLNIQ
jgi:hypothetical protein